MDGIFGVIDDSFKVSIVDSTMMLIVHRAMDKAHQRVKSREGVIERLHEISKFYELSVMQLDGCIKFVQEETNTQNPETTHQEVLAGLAEIRNRLQQRLFESELAIRQKDRELADRFKSEVKLRQALETTERELVSSQEDLELERSRSGAGSSNISPREAEDDGDQFGELKDSVDRQVWKIKEKLELDDYDHEPKVKNKRKHCINDLRVEEMGSDIDILKETLDIAFGKMQSAIFVSEMGPIEQQVKSSIENDIISICLKGFLRDCQEDIEVEARKKAKQVSISLNEHRSEFTNEEDIPIEKREEEFVENQRQMHQQQDEENNITQNQICTLRQEREDVEFQNIMMEEIYITLLQGLREKFCDDLSCWELEILISDSICRDFIRNMFDRLEETMERNQVEYQIKDDIYHVVLKEAMDDCCSIRQEVYEIPFSVMLKECQKNMVENTTENLVREEITRLVFSETIKSISDKGNHSSHTEFFNNFRKSCQILDETEREVCRRCKQVDVGIQDGNATEKLLELPHIQYDFEMANRKLEAIMVRLEEMQRSLDGLPQAMASVRENEALYKKAFIRRCQNLRKAENEVDLLGDEVDVLVSLIQKIYSILNQQSPFLQQYFDVSEILSFIKEEEQQQVNQNDQQENLILLGSHPNITSCEANFKEPPILRAQLCHALFASKFPCSPLYSLIGNHCAFCLCLNFETQTAAFSISIVTVK